MIGAARRPCPASFFHNRLPKASCLEGIPPSSGSPRTRPPSGFPPYFTSRSPRQQGGHHRAARPCGSTAASVGRRLAAAAVGDRARSVPAPIPAARPHQLITLKPHP
ncbi:MAG: hypothetical protein II757_06420 [Bacteroidales bacterium]|nr:hypothetical protein [Bacteroidales bacterium]